MQGWQGNYDTKFHGGDTKEHEDFPGQQAVLRSQILRFILFEIIVVLQKRFHDDEAERQHQ